MLKDGIEKSLSFEPPLILYRRQATHYRRTVECRIGRVGTVQDIIYNIMYKDDMLDIKSTVSHLEQAGCAIDVFARVNDGGRVGNFAEADGTMFPSEGVRWGRGGRGGSINLGDGLFSFPLLAMREGVVFVGELVMLFAAVFPFFLFLLPVQAHGAHSSSTSSVMVVGGTRLGAHQSWNAEA